MTTTSNLGLTIYSEASGSATTFLNFRLAVAGLTSNMSLIDTFAGWTSASITTIRSLSVHTASLSYISANYFEGNVTTITGYTTNLLINLKLNAGITGATTVNINSYGNKVLKKIDVNGSLVDLESGDLKINRYYSFIYNGTYFIFMGSQIGDQVSISGSSNRLVSISASGILVDSGVSASSIYQTGDEINISGSSNRLVSISASGILIDSGISASSITTTGISGSRTFYSASAAGGAVTTLNTIDMTNGTITSWTQT